MQMALFERNPSRRPSNSYSTATFVVFIVLVLVGAWMLTSTTFTPVSLPLENKSQTNERVSETESVATIEEQPVVTTDTQQEDTNSDTNTENFSETENKKGDGNENENKTENGNESESKTENGNESANGNGNDSVSYDEQNVPQKVTDKSDEKIEEENSSKPNEDTKSRSESKDDTENKPSEDAKGQSENSTPKFDDENGKTEGGELVTPGEGTQELISQNKTLETETTYESSSEKTDGKGSEQNTSNDESNNSDNDKVVSTGTTTSENQLESNSVSGQETAETELTLKQNKTDTQAESFPNVAQSELLNETSTQNGTFSTQVAESMNQKEIQSSSVNKKENNDKAVVVTWKLCSTSAGADYIPCLDNEAAIKKLRTTRHYEHRERHCLDEAPTCLVPLPEGYKRSIEWPHSRDKVI
jgi:Putative S-adenosyl-L-methionine-dependent methyltransferase